MQQRQDGAFDIDEARRVLADVFAPWVQDLGLSVESVDHDPPADLPADWQPGAVLRMAFSERLCRQSGVVCGQALMALADTAMVIAMVAANRGYRPMTTVDQTTHFMRAVASSDVLADARVIRLGRTMSFGRQERGAAKAHGGQRQAAGCDGLKRVRDALTRIAFLIPARACASARAQAQAARSRALRSPRQA